MTPSDRAAWVISLRVDAFAKSLLHVLAYRANDSTFKCWTTVERLTQDAGMSERKVQKLITKLQADGLLEVSRSAGRKSNLYRVNFKANPAHGAPLNGRQPRTACAPTPHTVRFNPAHGAPRTGIQQVLNNSATTSPSIWDLWIGIAGESKRGFLGIQIKQFGEDEVASAVAIVSTKRPADPSQYLIGILRKSKPVEVRRVAADF